MRSQTTPKFPIVDLSSEDLRPGTSSWVSACKDVRAAFEDYGCFIATCKKVSLDLHDKIFDAMKELFDLPYEVKIQNTADKPAHGYIGKIAAIPLHEGLGIDLVTNKEECQKFTHLMWPAGNDNFCELTHTYAKIVAELEQMVVKMLFDSYGLEKYYDSHVKSTRYLLRLLSYQKPSNDEPNLAFASHTDKSFISILHQNQVKGLELKWKDEEWIIFEPSPTSFVVFAGDVCMAWSNDRIKSCYHQIIMRGKEARYSLGLFSFRMTTVQPPEELIDEEHPLQYKPFDHDGLLRFYDTVEPRKKSERSMVKIYCGV